MSKVILSRLQNTSETNQCATEQYNRYSSSESINKIDPTKNVELWSFYGFREWRIYKGNGAICAPCMVRENQAAFNNSLHAASLMGGQIWKVMQQSLSCSTTMKARHKAMNCFGSARDSQGRAHSGFWHLSNLKQIRILVRFCYADWVQEPIKAI